MQGRSDFRFGGGRAKRQVYIQRFWPRAVFGKKNAVTYSYIIRLLKNTTLRLWPCRVAVGRQTAPHNGIIMYSTRDYLSMI